MKKKKKKENEKKDRLERQKILGLRWGMLRWITQYIKENEEEWEKQLNEKLEKERKELEDWNKYKRFDKNENLKKKWRKESTPNLENKSQQNLSDSEPSEEKSQQNLSNSEEMIENKSQPNLSTRSTGR